MKPIFLAFFLISSLNLLVSGDFGTDLKCLNSNQNARFNRGDTAVFCMHFLPNDDSTKAMRMSFQIVVDKYTAVQARGAYKNFKAYSALSSVSLVVQADNNFTSSDNSTYLRKSTDIGGTDIVVPIYSVVINIDNGKVTGTSWDNGCWDCTSLCYLDKISSSQTQSICRINPCNVSDSSGTTACDPKIYVTWIGTDSSGNHMNSAGLRISRFRQYSVGEMYSSALNTYDSVLQATKDQFNSQIEGNLNTLFGGSTTTVTTITFSNLPFTNGSTIPFKYTRDGGNTSPGLSWSGVSGASGYALVMNHSNTTGNFHHLLVKNIPNSLTSLSDGSFGGGVAINNTFGVVGYSGPEPTSVENTYNFYVYALNIATITPGSIEEFYSLIETNKVGVGSFVGKYQNTTTLLFV